MYLINKETLWLGQAQEAKALGDQGRALLYQKLLLSSNSEERLYLSSKLKESFIADELENAFNFAITIFKFNFMF